MNTRDVPKSGDVIGGKYRVLEEIGSGGMGVVLRATHLHLRETVAIKVLRPEISLRPESVARFMREARLTMKLRGEHIVRVYDVDVIDGRLPYIVMEHLEGEDLAMRIARDGALPPPLVVDWLLQTCEGVAEAHALGIIHRDLKPANLFLTKRGDDSICVKVLDFGVSKVSSLLFEQDHVTDASSDSKLPVAAVTGDVGPEDLTSTRMVLGSPRYMSPEQLESPRDVDVRTDIWALGTIAYEMLSGDPPFSGDDLEVLRRLIVEKTPKSLDAPPGLRAIVERCLAKDPDRRYANLAALSRALRDLAPKKKSRFAIALPILGVTGIGIAVAIARWPDATPPLAAPVSTPIASEPSATQPKPSASFGIAPPPQVATSAPIVRVPVIAKSVAPSATPSAIPSAAPVVSAAPVDAGKKPDEHLFDNPE